jgi:hypothetical protein
MEKCNVTKRILLPVLMAMLVAALAFGQDVKESKAAAKKEQPTATTAKGKKMMKKDKSCSGESCCDEGGKVKSKASKSESEAKAPESKDSK